MSAAALVILRQNRWISRFRELGATSPATAVDPARIHRSDSWLFRRMSARGVFRSTPDGRVYMDGPSAERFVAWRRRRFLTGFVVALLVVTLLLLV